MSALEIPGLKELGRLIDDLQAERKLYFDALCAITRCSMSEAQRVGDTAYRLCGCYGLALAALKKAEAPKL